MERHRAGAEVRARPEGERRAVRDDCRARAGAVGIDDKHTRTFDEHLSPVAGDAVERNRMGSSVFLLGHHVDGRRGERDVARRRGELALRDGIVGMPRIDVSVNARGPAAEADGCLGILSLGSEVYSARADVDVARIAYIAVRAREPEQFCGRAVAVVNRNLLELELAVRPSPLRIDIVFQRGDKFVRDDKFAVVSPEKTVRCAVDACRERAAGVDFHFTEFTPENIRRNGRPGTYRKARFAVGTLRRCDIVLGVGEIIMPFHDIAPAGSRRTVRGAVCAARELDVRLAVVIDVLVLSILLVEDGLLHVDRVGEMDGDGNLRIGRSRRVGDACDIFKAVRARDLEAVGDAGEGNRLGLENAYVVIDRAAPGLEDDGRRGAGRGRNAAEPVAGRGEVRVRARARPDECG